LEKCGGECREEGEKGAAVGPYRIEADRLPLPLWLIPSIEAIELRWDIIPGMSVEVNKGVLELPMGDLGGRREPMKRNEEVRRATIRARAVQGTFVDV
jgi:hypothetical protein